MEVNKLWQELKAEMFQKTEEEKVLKEAKGYFGSKHRLYKTAQEQVFHSGAFMHSETEDKIREISENYGLQESMLHVVKMKLVILNL